MVILVQQQLGALLHVLKVKWEMAFAMISTTKLNVNSIKVRSFLITYYLLLHSSFEKVIAVDLMC